MSIVASSGSAGRLPEVAGRRGALLALILVTSAPALAQEPATPWPVSLRADMARLSDLEFALRAAAGPSCRAQATASGIKIDYIAAYAPDQRDIVQRSTGLGDTAQVIAVAPESPAAQAGVIPGDDIIAINGLKFADMAAKSRSPGLLPDDVEDLLAWMPKGRQIVLEVWRGGTSRTFRFVGRRLCAARFYLKTDEGMSAYGDDRNVAIGRKYLAFVRNDDELAILTGHELAHIVAQDGTTGSIRTRRAMEDRADLLGADLARCAGYDMAKGLDLWRRIDKGDWLKWFREPSHRKTSDRIRRIAAHLAGPAPTCPPAVPPLSFD
jgi:hypothetical protein